MHTYATVLFPTRVLKNSKGPPRWSGPLPCRQPVSRILSEFAPETAIPLGVPLLTRSSNLPGGFRRPCLSAKTELPLARRTGTHRSLWSRAAVPSLFGLAPCGVYPALCVTAKAVRSYRTFSPLPALLAQGGRYLLCGTGRITSLEARTPGVTRHTALRSSDFPPPSDTCARPAAAVQLPAGLILPRFKSSYLEQGRKTRCTYRTTPACEPCNLQALSVQTGYPPRVDSL